MGVLVSALQRLGDKSTEELLVIMAGLLSEILIQVKLSNLILNRLASEDLTTDDLETSDGFN